MSRIGRAMERSTQALERASGGEMFTWGGSDYPCVANSDRAGAKLEAGGFAEDFDLALFVRKAVFATMPAHGQTLTFRSKRYRIDTVSNLPGNTTARLNCYDQNKGV